LSSSNRVKGKMSHTKKSVRLK